MDELKPPEVPASQALKEIAAHLKQGGSSTRPLALISDSYDRKKVAKELENQMGTSIVMTGSLLAAADYGEQDISLAALTYVNDDYQLAKTAASMRLLVRIYGFLREQSDKKKFRNPLAVSIMFRDILVEMDEECGLDPFAEGVESEAYSEELCFVRALWKEFLAPLRKKRRERLCRYADELKRTKSPIAYLHWGDASRQIIDFLKCAKDKGVPVKVCKAGLETEKSKQLMQLWRGKEVDEKPQFETSWSYHAQTLEEAARASKHMVYSWLQDIANKGSANIANKEDIKIGILAHDPKLARRLHSMLLQDDIHLQDTEGWPANNLLVGKALLALAASQNTGEKLLRKTQNIAARQKLGHAWTQAPRYLAADKERREKYKDKWEAVAEAEKELQEFINKYEGKHSVHEWFNMLADKADKGIYGDDFFTKDNAAHALRKLLRMLADEFENIETPQDHYSIDEIKRLLFDSLATTRLIPSQNESAIQLIKPGRFSTREFNAVLIAGADASNLPIARAPQLFNDEVREGLGLPSIAKKIEKQRKSLALILGNTANVGAVWHGEAGKSPYIELMGIKEFKALPPRWEGVKGEPQTESAAQLYELPEDISVSACIDMLRCPYKYYANKILRLSEDEGQAIGEKRNKYGTFVHAVLEKFHKDVKKDPSKATSENLKEIVADAVYRNPDNFKKTKGMSPAERRYFGWEFGHYIGPYVAEIRKLEKNGACITHAEWKMSKSLSNNVLMRGEADRIDKYGDDYAVIDVKTGNIDDYQDFQIPLYMHLYGKSASAEHTGFWALRLESGTVTVETPKPNDKKEPLDPSKVIELYENIFAQACPPDASAESLPLRANGVHKVCQHCSYGGLCRKKHWGR